MTELFSLGELYVSDFLRQDEQPRGGKVELKLVFDHYGEVRLEKVARLDTMYGRYWYRSGINATMRKELKGIVESITNVFECNVGQVWLDIACNDGTLLSYVPDTFIRIGVDPCDDSYKQEAERHSDYIIQDYFSARAYKNSCGCKVKVVTAIAVFYDIENRESFLRDVYEVMDDNGLFVLQLSYTPLMLKQLAFDNVVHEHIYYYSLFNLSRLFKDCGFKIVDCQLNDINGGSFRVYAMKDRGDVRLFGTQPYRDVCDFRISSLLDYEANLWLDDSRTWQDFFVQVGYLKEKVVAFIRSQVSVGKTVMAYGASTKGNTLLQYFGLDNTLITAIAERSPYKYGLRTVGTDIPIISEDEMRKRKPDYLLILPWHFINEFQKRESDYLNGGGHFIVPCPQFNIV